MGWISLMNYRFGIKQMLVLMAGGLLLAATVDASPLARVMTSGKIGVYRDGVLSQVLREDAPLPTGAVLKPEGNCGVRLENILIVAKDGSEFGVYNTSAPVQLALKKGMIYFAVNPSTGQMVFETPAGAVTMRQFYIQAAAGGNLKGFVEVNEGTTTLGVIEGGAMEVSTPGGEQTITAGNQIVLSQADSHSPAAATGKAAPGAKPAEAKSKISKKTMVNAGLLTAYGVAGTWLLVEELDDDDSHPAAASPATP